MVPSKLTRKVAIGPMTMKYASYDRGVQGGRILERANPVKLIQGKPKYFSSSNAEGFSGMAGFKCNGCACKIIQRGLCYDCARPGQRTIAPDPKRFAKLISR